MNIRLMDNIFRVDEKEITRIAQQIHNDIDESGEIDEDRVIYAIANQFAECFADWAREHIDWCEILDNDREAREFIAEREEAAKGQY